MHVKLFLSHLLLLLLLVLSACAIKKETDQHESLTNDQVVWNEMDTFHMVMAETFHPYKDSADLMPVKMRANELKAAAMAWARVPLPVKVDNEKVKLNLKKLNSQASKLAEIVNTGDDGVIGDQLNKLHDTFHELQEAWYNSDK